MNIDFILLISIVLFKSFIRTSSSSNEYWTSYVGFDFKSPSGNVTGPRDFAQLANPKACVFDELNEIIYFVSESGYQVYTVSVFNGSVSALAGVGTSGYLDSTFSTSYFRDLYGLALNTEEGSIYVSSPRNHIIRKLFLSNSTVSTFAGSSSIWGTANGRAADARFNGPMGIFYCDKDQNLYVADSMNHMIRKISPAGDVTTIAGNGGQGYVDGPAMDAAFNSPTGVAVNPISLDIFVTDQKNHVVRRVSQSLNMVSTFAGSYEGFADAQGNQAKFSRPEGISIDNEGNLYISDGGNLVIRKINTTGFVSTIVGRPGIIGTESGPGLYSSFKSLSSIYSSRNGTLFFSDNLAGRIRIAFKASEKSLNSKYFWHRDDFNCYTGYCVNTIIGSGKADSRNGPALDAATKNPRGIFYHEETGDLYVTETGSCRIIVRIANESQVYRIAGSACGYANGSLYDAKFTSPIGIIFDGGNQTILVSDFVDHTIRQIYLKTGEVSIFAGAYNRNYDSNGQGGNASFSRPSLLAVDAAKNLFIADHSSHSIRKSTATGFVSHISGAPYPGCLFRDNLYSDSRYCNPFGVAVDATGSSIYVSDMRNHRIRSLSGGRVTTMAGNGTVNGTISKAVGSFADGQGTDSRLNMPRGIAIDKFGNIYFADSLNNRIRKINTTGYVSTIAGRGSAGSQDGVAIAAEFNQPYGLQCSSDGSKIFVADSENHRVKVICMSTCLNNGIMNCITGTCKCPAEWKGNDCSISNTGNETNSPNAIKSMAFIDDGWSVSYAGVYDSIIDFDGPRWNATFKSPQGIAFDKISNIVYISDSNGYIKKIDSTGYVSHYSSAYGSLSSVDSPITTILFNNPRGLVFDNQLKILYVCESDSHVIRKVNVTSGMVTTIAGSSGNSGSEDGIGGNARLFFPRYITLDLNGVLIITEDEMHRIRQISPINQNVSTIAGRGFSGYKNGPSSNALFYKPCGVTVDSQNNIFVADTSNHVIRKISSNRLEVSTFAGCYAGDSSIGNEFSFECSGLFNTPIGLTIDDYDNLYVTDSVNRKIKKIDPSGRRITTIAGSGGAGTKNNEKALKSNFQIPNYLQTMSSKNGTTSLLVSDIFGGVRIVYPTSTGSPYNMTDNWNCGSYPSYCVQTLAGNGIRDSFNGPAFAISSLNGPEFVAIDETRDRIFFTEDFGKITRQIYASDGNNLIVTDFVGRRGSNGSSVGQYITANFSHPAGIVMDPTGAIMYMSDSDSHTIRKIIVSNGTVLSFAGLPGTNGSDDGDGESARFSRPWDLARDSVGNIYVAGNEDNKIRVITPAGIVSTFAGSGISGYVDGAVGSAQFNRPRGIAVAKDLNGIVIVYVSDTNNHAIRKIDSSTLTVSTIAGSAAPGYLDGPGNSSKFNQPMGITWDEKGQAIFVFDYGNRRLRKIDANLQVTTIAGTGYLGNQEGLGEKAQFNEPRGNLAIDTSGRIYFADWGSNELKIVCQSPCIYGILVDCISLTCQCDSGWTGATCDVSSTRYRSSTRSSETLSYTEKVSISKDTTTLTHTEKASISKDKTTFTSSHPSVIFDVHTSSSNIPKLSSSLPVEVYVILSLSIVAVCSISVVCFFRLRRKKRSTFRMHYSMNDLIPKPGLQSSNNNNNIITQPYAPSMVYNEEKNEQTNRTIDFSDQTSNTLSLTSGKPIYAVPGYLRLYFGVDFDIEKGNNDVFGSGGSGSLYTGRVLTTDLIQKLNLESTNGKFEVAVKMIMKGEDQNVSFEDERLSALKYELGIMAGLNGHPNIVELIGYTEAPPFNSIVMRKYSSSLQKLILDTSINNSQYNTLIYPITNDISRGIQFIHSKGLIHMDIKPLNVLIDSRDNGNFFKCVICDFGAASMVGNMHSPVKGFNMPGEMEFTPRYSPPETLSRLYVTKSRPIEETDKKIDVYAFAVVVYELLTRKKAFQGMDAKHICDAVNLGIRPEWPNNLVREDNNFYQLVNLVNLCWSRVPSHRPTFDEIVKTIQGSQQVS